MPLSFSIIIPTRNRSRLLKTTLLCLQAQDYPREAFEIIVVNNDPDDMATASVVQALQKSMKNLVYCVENQQGSSFARNTGCRKAKHLHLIFIDDDITVRPDFLRGYAYAWDRYPQARILGGQLVAELDNGEPFTRTQQHLLKKHPWCFAQMDWVSQDMSLRVQDILFSANMSYRRNPAEHSLFSCRVGVQFYLNEQFGIEDIELFTRTILKGEQVVLLSSEMLVVRHRISKIRFTDSYLTKRFFLAGIEMYLLEDILSHQFPHFQPFYMKQMKSWRGVGRLLSDKYERQQFLSYLFNGKYFV